MSLRRFVGFSSCHAHTLRLQKSYCDLNRGTLLSRNPPVDTAPINVLFFFFFYPVADRESYSQRNNLTTTFLHHRRRQRRPEYHTTTLLVSPRCPLTRCCAASQVAIRGRECDILNPAFLSPSLSSWPWPSPSCFAQKTRGTAYQFARRNQKSFFRSYHRPPVKDNRGAGC